MRIPLRQFTSELLLLLRKVMLLRGGEDGFMANSDALLQAAERGKCVVSWRCFKNYFCPSEADLEHGNSVDIPALAS